MDPALRTDQSWAPDGRWPRADPRRAPLLPRAGWALVAVWLGCVLGARGWAIGPWWWFSLGLGALAVALLVPARWAGLALWVAAALASAGWSGLRLVQASPDHVCQVLARATGDRAWLGLGQPGAEHAGLWASVEGLVVEPAALRLAPPDSWAPGVGEPAGIAQIEARRVRLGDRERRVHGTVRVAVPVSMVGAMEAGRSVRVRGLLRPPVAAWGGGTDAARAAGAQRRGPVLRLPDDPSAVAGSVAGAFDQLRGRGVRARAWARGVARDALDRAAPWDANAQRRALLGALLLGEIDPQIAGLAGAMGRTGVLHVLCVSGYHVSVMLALIGACCRLAMRPGVRRWVVLSAAAGALVVIVPDGAPVWRAAVMAWAGLSAQLIGWRIGPLTVLGWAGVLLLLADPAEASDMGWQLSVLCTAGLIVAPGALSRRARRLPGAGLLAGGAAAWAMATPVLVAHTGVISPAGLVLSVLLAPVGAAALWLGYGLMALAGLAGQVGGPGLIAALGWPLHLVSGAIPRLVSAADDLPGASAPVAGLGVAWAAWMVAGLWVAGSAGPSGEGQSGEGPDDIGPDDVDLDTAGPKTQGLREASADRAHARWAPARRGLGVAAVAAGLVWAAGALLGLTRTPGQPAASGLRLGGAEAGVVVWPGGGVVIDAGSASAGSRAALTAGLSRALHRMGAARVPVAVVTRIGPAAAGSIPDGLRARGLRAVVVPRWELDGALRSRGRGASAWVASLRRAGVALVPVDERQPVRVGPVEITLERDLGDRAVARVRRVGHADRPGVVIGAGEPPVWPAQLQID
ncbi:MAG: hypothetical protein C0513_06220 [Isosphaera sp.]|nr:hypothetical protein [Isosphaera sp.]